MKQVRFPYHTAEKFLVVHTYGHSILDALIRGLTKGHLVFPQEVGAASIVIEPGEAGLGREETSPDARRDVL